MMTRHPSMEASLTSSSVDCRAAEFGVLLMHMAEPYGVEAIAIGSLPSNLSAFPFCENVPAPLQPRLAFGWRPETTHFFFATSMEDEIRHVVCRSDAHRDAEMSCAGPGFAFPIGGGAARGAIFFGSEICQEDSSGRVLALLAHYAYARMLMILRARTSQMLSERQLEVLSWAAEGKTDYEIAEILGLSNHTIDKYMRQIKEALGAVSRTAAIVAAMRGGLIA